MINSDQWHLFKLISHTIRKYPRCKLLRISMIVGDYQNNNFSYYIYILHLFEIDYERVVLCGVVCIVIYGT